MCAQPGPNRPRTVTITLWSVIFFGTWNIGRAYAIGQQLNLQQALNIKPDPRVRLAAAVLFGFLFFGLAGMLWWRRPFVINAVPVTISSYTIYETAVWLLFAQPPRNWMLWLLTSLVLICTALFTRWALRRAAKTFFHHGCLEK